MKSTAEVMGGIPSLIRRAAAATFVAGTIASVLKVRNGGERTRPTRGGWTPLVFETDDSADCSPDNID